MWEATSDFPHVDAELASIIGLPSNFYSYKEVVETFCYVHLGEGGNSDVMDRPRRVESCDNLSVFRTSVGNVLTWLEFLLFLMLGIKKSFWKLERGNDSKILAVKPFTRNQRDQILGCSSVETNEWRQEPGLEKLKQVFRNYVSRSEKCQLVPENAIDTSNFPSSIENMQGCESGFEQSSSLGCSNQRLRLNLRLKVGHGSFLAIKKTPLLKMSSGRKVV